MMAFVTFALRTLAAGDGTLTGRCAPLASRRTPLRICSIHRRRARCLGQPAQARSSPAAPFLSIPCRSLTSRGTRMSKAMTTSSASLRFSSPWSGSCASLGASCDTGRRMKDIHVTPPCQGTAHPHHASACQSPDGQGAREARRTLCPLSPRAHHVTAAVVRSLCRNFYSHGACKNMWILSFEVAALSLRLRVSAVGTSGFAHRRPSRLGWLARLSGAPAPCQGSGTGGHGARQVLRPHCSCRAGHATRLPVGGGRTGGGARARLWIARTARHPRGTVAGGDRLV